MSTPSLTLATQPAAVTVFPDRARVTRVGRAPVEAGPQRLEIGGLPLNLLPDSVRASGRGTARAKLLGVTTRLEHFTETPAEAVLKLEQAIESAEDADHDLLAQVGVLEREQTHLDSLAAQSEMYARGLALRNRTPEEQGAIYDFVGRRSRALQAELLSLNRQRRERAKELDRLRRELKALQAARPRQRYIAAVEVEVLEAGELEVELSYVVTGASWEPLYDLRLAEAELEVTYLAQISQNTAEDWTGVRLAVSTARPSLSLVIPELQPWYVRPRPPVVRVQAERAKRSGPMAPMAAAPQPASFAAPVEPEPMRHAVADMDADEAAVSETGAALTYTLGGAADVPGNGEPRKVSIALFRLRPDLTYVSAPKLEAVCYRRAEVKNDSPYSLLPGEAQLFEGEEYLGATSLEFVAPGQTFELALGADERLRVERELKAREVDKASLLGDRRRVRYAYAIELENLRDAPQEVRVRDQIPVAQDEQIKVRLDAADPKPAEQTELNQLEWKLMLDPHAKRVIRFEFSVEHPRALDVIGLP
jgi:uncharacterized protein (TIGR02231 family)